MWASTSYKVGNSHPTPHKKKKKSKECIQPAETE